jgi:transposase
MSKTEEMFPDEPVVEVRERARKGLPKIQEVNRNQLVLRSTDIESLVEEDHRIRAIWDFVCRLDLRGFYEAIETEEGEAGRPAIDPRVLVTLWIFAYTQGVSSGREISRLCEYHPAYQWATGLQEINYHTISDFRTNNREALDQLFMSSLAILSQTGLVELITVSHDGCKIKANAKGASFHTRATLEDHLELAREHLKKMDEQGEQEVTERKRKAAQRAAREKKEKLEKALETLKELQEEKSAKEKEKVRVSETDPDARNMKQPNGGFDSSYNVQISTDTTEGMIVGLKVTAAGNDRGLLPEAVENIVKLTGKEPSRMLADSDFATRETILGFEEKGIELFSSVINQEGRSAGQYRRRGISEEFHSKHFLYNSESDTFICPAGKLLTYAKKEKDIGITRFYYIAQSSDCKSCPFKAQCTPGTDQRTVSRVWLDPTIEAFQAKMETPQAKEIYKKRSRYSEFTNAWIKEKFNVRQFRLRGLNKINMEMIWVALAYNICQWIRIARRKLNSPLPGVLLQSG